MLRINNRTHAALFLRLGYHMYRYGCFTGGFRAIYFDNSSFWKPTHAQSHIQANGSG